MPLILTLGSTTVRASGPLGWLVFEHPQPGSQKATGKARRILSAWFQKDTKTVEVVDEEGDGLLVHFLFEPHAKAFLDSVEKGDSYDVTECAKVQGDPIPDSVRKVGFGYLVYYYEARFECAILDTPRPIAASSVTPELYSSPKELKVLIPVSYDTIP